MASKSNDSIPSTVGIYVLIYCLLEGLQRVSGVLFLASVELLGACRLSASVPFLLSRATANFTGVLLHFVEDQHQKPRAWISWGIFISASGVGLCFLTTEVLWMAVFWGIVFGAGIGIAVPVLIAELTKDTHQTLVSTLLPATPSFGCIVLPFLIITCVSNYGLDGCFLILAGLILNSIPFIYIAKYQFKFRLPRPKWRLRKRSKRYQMSQKAQENCNVTSYKPRGLQEFCNESFLENLEPDALQKVSDADDCSMTKHEFVDIFQPIINAKKKMTTANISGKKSFETKQDRKSDEYPKNKNHFDEQLSKIVADVHKYENNRKPFEKSFSHMDVLSQNMSNSMSCCYKNAQIGVKGSDSDNSLVESLETKEWKEVEKAENIANFHQKPPPIISATNTTFHVQKATSPQVNQTKNMFPVEIKVHVVECTITTNAEFFEQSCEQEVPSVNRKAYRRHSNSLISDCYDNIDFTKLLLNSKATPLQKHQFNAASRMFLITEEDENEFDNRHYICHRNGDIEALKKDESKAIRTIQKIRKLLKPSCLVVMYAFVTYELTLAVLLTMFADFAKDTKDTSISSNVVMVAFGVGGLLGQMSFTHWGNRLLADGSHAAAAIIFMLNGLAVAGILWSASICWMSGFYAILGFVESGILLILPKLVTDYIEEKSIAQLSSTCKCLSGIAILCMPFAMGLSRDSVGDYEGLLQVTSCLSVVCALLCYFLPRLFRQSNAASK